jgi:hypothetical protein
MKLSPGSDIANLKNILFNKFCSFESRCNLIENDTIVLVFILSKVNIFVANFNPSFAD